MRNAHDCGTMWPICHLPPVNLCYKIKRSLPSKNSSRRGGPKPRPFFGDHRVKQTHRTVCRPRPIHPPAVQSAQPSRSLQRTAEPGDASRRTPAILPNFTTSPRPSVTNTSSAAQPRAAQPSRWPFSITNSRTAAQPRASPPLPLCKSVLLVWCPPCNPSPPLTPAPPPALQIRRSCNGMVLCAAHVRMEKDFDRWNEKKKYTHKREFADHVHEREVWWSALGVNIGVEIDGKHENFERPVLVVRKFNNDFDSRRAYYVTGQGNALPCAVYPQR